MYTVHVHLLCTYNNQTCCNFLTAYTCTFAYIIILFVVRIISGMGGLIEQNVPFHTVKTLLTRLLGLDTCGSIHDKEELILQHITDDKMRKYLPLLNDLLVLKVLLFVVCCYYYYCLVSSKFVDIKHEQQGETNKLAQASL